MYIYSTKRNTNARRLKLLVAGTMMTYAVAAAVDVTAVVRDVTRTVAQLDVLGLGQVSLVLNVIQFCRVTQNPVRPKRYIKFYLRNEYSPACSNQ